MLLEKVNLAGLVKCRLELLKQGVADSWLLLALLQTLFDERDARHYIAAIRLALACLNQTLCLLGKIR